MGEHKRNKMASGEQCIVLSDKAMLAGQRQGPNGKLIDGVYWLASWKRNLSEEWVEGR